MSTDVTGVNMIMSVVTFINEHCRDGGEYDHECGNLYQ